jgi:glycosyltransferase involved in cell wall biosynthesis
MPAVTVAIPAYKAEHLSQAIASVLAQTFEDFELLISDDCPNDSVRRVVERFADPRIRVIAGPRRGLVPNSVHLWENAACDLLKYLYDDDFLLPFGLAELVDLLRGDPKLTYAFCARHIVDENGKVLDSPQPIAKPTVLAPKVVPEALIGGIINPIGEPSNLLIRRSVFPDSSCLSHYGGVGVRHNIDVAFFLNAGERGACVGTPVFGSAFRRHGAQATTSRRAPNFAYSACEWELYVRVAVSCGLVAPELALKSFDRLYKLYAGVQQDFAEIGPLAGGLPELRARLENRRRDLLDEAFLARFAGVETAASAREAAS